ncbi:hypothetical protein ACFL55_03300, partial [Candidatus Latescibacterota bacterium]
QINCFHFSSFKPHFQKNPMTSSYIFTALLWSSIGFGFFIYGKKQKAIIPLVGGILLMGISYAVRTPLNLSLVSAAIIAGIVVARKMM